MNVGESYFWGGSTTPPKAKVPWSSHLYVSIIVCVCFKCISRHLDFFEMLRNEDELLLSKRFDTVSPIDGFLLPNESVCFKADEDCVTLPSSRSMWRPRAPARCLTKSRRTWSTPTPTLTCCLRCSTASSCPVSIFPLLGSMFLHHRRGSGDSSCLFLQTNRVAPCCTTGFCWTGSFSSWSCSQTKVTTLTSPCWRISMWKTSSPCKFQQLPCAPQLNKEEQHSYLDGAAQLCVC